MAIANRASTLRERAASDTPGELPDVTVDMAKVQWTPEAIAHLRAALDLPEPQPPVVIHIYGSPEPARVVTVPPSSEESHHD